MRAIAGSVARTRARALSVAQPRVHRAGRGRHPQGHSAHAWAAARGVRRASAALARKYVQRWPRACDDPRRGAARTEARLVENARTSEREACILELQLGVFCAVLRGGDCPLSVAARERVRLESSQTLRRAKRAPEAPQAPKPYRTGLAVIEHRNMVDGLPPPPPPPSATLTAGRSAPPWRCSRPSRWPCSTRAQTRPAPPARSCTAARRSRR